MKKLLSRLYLKWFLTKHQYALGTLIHRRKAYIIYEIDFNWYDEDFQPVSVIREVKSGKIFSVRHLDMYDFKEYTGSDPNAGANL